MKNLKPDKIVIINQSTGYLTIDIVNAYAEKYSTVVLIAGHVEVNERKLNPLVKIHKIQAYDKTSLLKRVLSWIIAYIQVLSALAFKYRRYEVVYFTNPPMCYFSSLFVKNKFSIIIYDIYPDALKNIGIKENNFIYNCWVQRNKKLFCRAEKIITLSNGMAHALSKYIDISKIRIIYNWPSSNNFTPINKNENPFAREHHLENKFVVMYSGNMGYTHSVDKLVDLALKLRDNDTIHFLLIGDGPQKSELEKVINDRKLTNCTLLNWQPVEILPYSLAVADLGVITLNESSAVISVPSKTYNLLAVGAPLLCICPKTSEMVSLVNKYHNGKCFSCGDIDGMADYIIFLTIHRTYCKQLSYNSLIASKSFTRNNAYLYL